MKKIMSELRYWGIMALLGLVRIIPNPVAVLIGKSLGALVWAVYPPFRRVSDMQMQAALGGDYHWSLSLEMAMHIGRIPVDVIKCLHMQEEDLWRRIEFVGLEHMNSALASGRGVMCVSAHIGNWELIGHMPNYIKQDFHVLMNIRSDTRMESIVRHVRGRLPGFIIEPPRGGMVSKSIGILRDGRHVGLMVDIRGKHGMRIFCNVLGLPAPTSPAPALIALKGDAIVVPVHALTKGNSFQIIFDVPIDTRDYGGGEDVPDKLTECWKSEPVMRLSARLQDWVSGIVSAHPTQWIWLYSRWVRRSDIRRLIRNGKDFHEHLLNEQALFLNEHVLR